MRLVSTCMAQQNSTRTKFCGGLLKKRRYSQSAEAFPLASRYDARYQIQYASESASYSPWATDCGTALALILSTMG
eukprot:COSAG01_NODE_2054_length_8538_cov_4.853656_2_plen_76_part_00